MELSMNFILPTTSFIHIKNSRIKSNDLDEQMRFKGLCLKRSQHQLSGTPGI